MSEKKKRRPRREFNASFKTDAVKLVQTGQRHLSLIAKELAVVDASFIGLSKLADVLSACIKPGGTLVALVKPQFEAGREAVCKGNGVVTDEVDRQACIDEAVASVAKCGFEAPRGERLRDPRTKGQPRGVLARAPRGMTRTL